MAIRIETGPMFSGKSGVLVEAIKRRIIGNQKHGIDFLVFNFSGDTRYGTGILSSHNKAQVRAIPVSFASDLLRYITKIDKRKNELVLKKQFLRLRSIYIDEAQFFDTALTRIVIKIDELFRIYNGHHSFEIVIGGLDTDFRGEPFGPMPELMARADSVTKHVAVCSVCGENNATKTQRLVNGKPASWHDPVVMVGAKELYTARCPMHHEVLQKPVFQLPGSLLSKL